MDIEKRVDLGINNSPSPINKYNTGKFPPPPSDVKEVQIKCNVRGVVESEKIKGSPEVEALREKSKVIAMVRFLGMKFGQTPP